MTPEHAVIARDFDPSDLRPLLDACGIDRTILVQSSCTDGDTDAMFSDAAKHDWIVIANPEYGSFESAPFESNYKLSADERRQKKIDALPGWEGPKE